ncbi:hypothetical protein IMSAGC019_00593 [Lachnospiraceae bacterium]|nr:hypothetical protein IMSAGC019_00593 [Lachnospiraceae bacterium]
MAKKIICESCGTVFPFEKAKDFTVCPVCNASFDDEENETSSIHDDELSFGDDIELSENDSFDEDKIDFWWYSIREPGEIWKGITFEDGNVSINCAKCGHFAGSAPYPIARTKDCLLIDPRFTIKCGHCGNELKNHIFSKRPADWVDPRKRDMWVKDYKNIPKCPICSSTKIHKISMTNKAASALVFGVLSAGHVSKTYKCDTCGAKF